jgi:ribonuclease P protein component
MLERACFNAETNLPTKEETTHARPRIQGQNAYQERQKRPETADVQRAPKADGLSLLDTRTTAYWEFTDTVCMQPERRLRKSREFAAVWREGRSRSDGRLVAIARRGESTTRFGFSVSKRLGKAVTRNKIKRRLKAAAASANVEEGWDVVVIARQGAAPASFWELRRSMKRLLKRLHVSTSKKRTARRTT